MEISWYLRFSRKEGVEVLADNSTYSQIKNTLYTAPEWKLETEELPGHIRAAFIRKKTSEESE